MKDEDKGQERGSGMNVAQIVKKYLEEHGFDGLAGDRCGCSKDYLMACDICPSDCEPAYIKRCICTECKEKCENFDWTNLIDCYSVAPEVKT